MPCRELETGWCQIEFVPNLILRLHPPALDEKGNQPATGLASAFNFVDGRNGLRNASMKS